MNPVRLPSPPSLGAPSPSTAQAIIDVTLRLLCCWGHLRSGPQMLVICTLACHSSALVLHSPSLVPDLSPCNSQCLHACCFSLCYESRTTYRALGSSPSAHYFDSSLSALTSYSALASLSFTLVSTEFCPPCNQVLMLDASRPYIQAQKQSSSTVLSRSLPIVTPHLLFFAPSYYSSLLLTLIVSLVQPHTIPLAL